MDPDQIEASIAVAKAHQDKSLMAIEQAIDLEKKAYEKKKEAFEALTVHTASAKAPPEELRFPWKPPPVIIALDPDWRFKLVQKAILPSITTAPKRDVYQKVLGVDGIKFLPMTH